MKETDTRMVADVALDPRSVGNDAIYTYLADKDLEVGFAVFVPLGTRTSLGFVTRIYETTEEHLGFRFSQLRRIQGQVENLGLPAPVMDLCQFVSQETLCPLPVAISPAIPPGVKDRLLTVWKASENTGQPADLSPVQAEVLRVLRSGQDAIEQKGKPIQAGTLKALKALRSLGLVVMVKRLANASERKARTEVLSLTSEGQRVEDFLRKEGRKKPAQALTLMRMQEGERARLTMAELKTLAGVTESTVKALLNSGLLESVEHDEPTDTNPPTPNYAQQIAIDALSEAVRERDGRTFLLFGVTGSGKTEVYLRATSEALKEGRQVLFLVPEIALATQAIARLRERFGRGVAVLHSELPDSERLKNWLQVKEGSASIIVGARSALFAPVKNLGLIVIDEEHEASYKQDSAPRYHGKTLARFLAGRHDCPVVLGSATPSVETFYEADEGDNPDRITLLSLPQRAANAHLPEVAVEDLGAGFRTGKPSLLCDDLSDRIKETLAKGQQVILFLNRRAYSPFVICRDCGNQMQCPNCAVSLSFHRQQGKLKCHHCGFQMQPTETCPKCGGSRLSAFGVGTEKVQEFVAELFPQTQVSRLDRDVARRKGALEETFAAFRAGDIGILVGTQMIAKGLDFPNVTLVGAIAADMSLNIPDFRASERTFQLLAQVAGRAGRGEHAGSVIIQTFNPSHPAIVTAQTHDYLSFYEHLIQERREANYPPFCRLVNIIFSGEHQDNVQKAAAETKRRLDSLEIEILGPVDCAIERLQGKWRRHMLLKLGPKYPLEPVRSLIGDLAWPDVSMVIDVDPYNLM